MTPDLLSYENLDSIADAVNPITGLFAIGVCIYPIVNKNWLMSLKRSAAFLSGMAATYGLMFLDNKLKIWSAFGMDYSTHTAFALSVWLFLTFSLRKYWILWASVMVGYVLLMLYQHYHTVGDVASTAAAVGILIAAPYYFLLRPSLSTKSLPSPA